MRRRTSADPRPPREGRRRAGRDPRIALGGQVLKQTIEVLTRWRGRDVGHSGRRARRPRAALRLRDAAGPHRPDDTISDVEIKSALAGASRSIYYGVTRVGEGAAGADANQANRNLLLSDHAKADSDPVLEILIADVVALRPRRDSRACGPGGAVLPAVARPRLPHGAAAAVAGFFQSVVGDIALPGVDGGARRARRSPSWRRRSSTADDGASGHAEERSGAASTCPQGEVRVMTCGARREVAVSNIDGTLLRHRQHLHARRRTAGRGPAAQRSRDLSSPRRGLRCAHGQGDHACRQCAA